MTDLRRLAKAAWSVRDDPPLKFSAENWTGYYDSTDDTIAAAGPLDRKVPRLGAVAVIAYEASQRLGLDWKVAPTSASAMKAGMVVAIVDALEKKAEPYRIRITSEWWSPTLHLAAMHGVTLIRQEVDRPKARRAR